MVDHNFVETGTDSSQQNSANGSLASNNQLPDVNVVNHFIVGSTASSSHHNNGIENHASNNQLPNENIVHVAVEENIDSCDQIIYDPPSDPLAVMKNEHERLDLLHNENIVDVAAELVQAENEIQFDRIDDDIYIQHIVDEIPLPSMEMFQLKQEDPLTGNTPFIEHVSIQKFMLSKYVINNYTIQQAYGDRTYIIQLEDNVNKRLMMKKVYIDILNGWNELKTAAGIEKQDIKGDV